MLLSAFAWPDMFSTVAAHSKLVPTKTATRVLLWRICCVLRYCSDVGPLVVLAVVRPPVILAVALAVFSSVVHLLAAAAAAAALLMHVGAAKGPAARLHPACMAITCVASPSTAHYESALHAVSTDLPIASMLSQ